MGFYAPHTIFEDARRHGVAVLPVDVNASAWDCTLEAPPGDGAPVLGNGPKTCRSGLPPATHSDDSASGNNPSACGSGLPTATPVRIGLRQVRGLSQKTAEALVAARKGGYSSVGDLARRARIPRHDLVRLATAGALDGICGGRREAIWEIQSLGPLDEDDLFFGMAMDDASVDLPPLTLRERVAEDYASVGVSLEKHPTELFRPLLQQRGALTAKGLHKAKAGRKVKIGGLVICRQRPPTAKGFCFLSVEDETGIANLVVPPALFEKHRRALLGSTFIYAEGTLERAGRVVNLKVERAAQMAL
jgi:error-prone DNA polymerase